MKKEEQYNMYIIGLSELVAFEKLSHQVETGPYGGGGGEEELHGV